MSLDLDNKFGLLENPYESSDTKTTTTISINTGYVGNIKDNNKYIGNTPPQTPYWTQGGSAIRSPQEFVSLGMEDPLNSTFELNIDNPYLQKEPEFDKIVSSKPSDPLLQQMKDLSSNLYIISNATSDVSGIGGVKEHEIIVKIDHIDHHDKFGHSSSKTSVIEVPKNTTTIVPLEDRTAFLGNTTSLPIVDERASRALPSTNVLERSLITSTPRSVVEAEEDVRPSKWKKVLLWTLISILIVAGLLFLVFWLIEFFGAVDFVVWPGFDPSTSVN